ncbi:(2Fe-2S)-binding protein [Streptomyces tagetis]|uniref:(2Fe-2S)-binding protein n=1 Tax=Streptomyces tagetis TaxID=2820809 RepID=A0A940XK03_9ACTN|nr:(2Fe-2S)-binding protein [Streptomyces sp. RG38]MBQ0826040.1 (2Fe-2S)-binding protein [Streptomyces sp. RG38]
MDLDPGLTAPRALGGFFALRTGAPPRPLPALARAYAAGADRAPEPDGNPRPDGDPHADPLAFRVRKVAGALRTPEPRVAASVAHQGLAARLWSVALGCAALDGRVPDLDPGRLCWDPDGSAPDDLWLTGVRTRPADTDALAATVIDAHLVPLAALLHARHRVATGLLWGNAASALAGACRELDRWARRHGRTDTAARARDLTAALLAHPALAGTGTLTGTAFRRRSCCLYYRAPGAGVCGDCCFPSPPGPRA